MLFRSYQARFAVAVKKAVGDKMFVGGVGGIKNGHLAEEVMQRGIDVVLVGRQFLRDYQTVWTFAEQLGINIKLPNQIDWVFAGRGSQRAKVVKEDEGITMQIGPLRSYYIGTGSRSRRGTN